MDGEIEAGMNGQNNDRIQCTILKSIEKYMDNYVDDSVEDIIDVTYVGPGSEEAETCGSGEGAHEAAPEVTSIQLGSIFIPSVLIGLVGLGLGVYAVMRRRKHYKKCDGFKDPQFSFDTDTCNSGDSLTSPSNKIISVDGQNQESEHLITTADVKPKVWSHV